MIQVPRDFVPIVPARGRGGSYVTDRSKRRLDRIFDPAYVAELEGLPIEDIRMRKAECEELESELSYARRLLQGKLDILREALERRAGGGQSGLEQLIHRLPKILADDEMPSIKRHSPVSIPRNAEKQRREVERLSGDLTQIDEMDPADLTETIDMLAKAELAASRDRRMVQDVLDKLNNELIRRYREGQADPTALIGS